MTLQDTTIQRPEPTRRVGIDGFWSQQEAQASYPAGLRHDRISNLRYQSLGLCVPASEYTVPVVPRSMLTHAGDHDESACSCEPVEDLGCLSKRQKRAVFSQGGDDYVGDTATGTN